MEEQIYRYLIFFDLETTGLDTAADEPTEIAAVVTDLDGRELHAEAYYVQTGRRITAEAQNLTGITPEKLRVLGIPPQAAAWRWLNLLHRYPGTLMGFASSHFDYPLLWNWLQRVLGPEFFLPGVGIHVDLQAQLMHCLRHPWGRLKSWDDNVRADTWLSLRAAAELYGVDFNPDALHGAIQDAHLTRKLYMAMHDPRTPAPGSSEPLPS